MTAWEKLKAGKIDLKAEPKVTGDPKFKSRYAELCYKLSNLIPAIKDDTLANLLHFTLDGIENHVEERNSVPRFGAMVKIANQALKAAHMSLGAPLVSKNQVVGEHMKWLRKFDPDKILCEDLFPDEDVYTDVVDAETAQFDPEDFAVSPEVIDMIHGRNPSDPEENVLTPEEIKSTLETYIRRNIEMHSDYFNMGFNEDLSDVVDTLYDDAVSALQNKGFIVENNFNDEDSLQEDMSDLLSMPDALSMSDDILSMSDIMMPKGDQGDSLIKSVTKQMITDPDTKKQRPPDSTYVNRLQALGWETTAGPDGQPY